MKLDLSEIARIAGSEAEHEIDMTFKEFEGLKLTAPVRGIMHVSSTGRVLLLEGNIDTEVEMVCFRCGANYQQPVHAEFQEDFIVHPPQAQHGGPRVEEEDEAPESRLFFPGTLDLNLDELLRQSILIALPLKPLCAEDCQGLCPRCGHPMNDGPCQCQPETTNPQLAELQRLFKEREHKRA